jgi:hypothetical protein
MSTKMKTHLKQTKTSATPTQITQPQLGKDKRDDDTDNISLQEEDIKVSSIFGKKIQKRKRDEDDSDDSVSEDDFGSLVSSKTKRLKQTPNIKMATSVKQLRLENGIVTYKCLKEFYDQLITHDGFDINRQSHIPKRAWLQIRLACGALTPDAEQELKIMDNEDFFALVFSVYVENPKLRVSSIQASLQKIRIKWDLLNEDPIYSLSNQLLDIFESQKIDYTTLDAASSEQYIEILQKNIFKNNNMAEQIGADLLTLQNQKKMSMFEWIGTLTKATKKAVETCLTAQMFGMVKSKSEEEEEQGGKPKFIKQSVEKGAKFKKYSPSTQRVSFVSKPFSPSANNNATTHSKECKICGRVHHGECRLKNHPNANTTSNAWSDSLYGKEFKKVNILTLPYKQYLKDGRLTEWLDAPKFSPKKLGKVSNCFAITDDNNNVPMWSISERTCLLDSGSTHNVIKRSIIKSNCNCTQTYAKFRICSAFGSCKNIENIVTCSTIKFILNDTCFEIKNFNALVVDDIPFDVIVGLNTIIKYDLTKVFREYWSSELSQNMIAILDERVTTPSATLSYISDDQPIDHDPLIDQNSWLYALISKEEIFEEEFDDDEIEQYYHAPPWEHEEEDNNIELDINKNLANEQVKQLKDLLNKYKDRFKITVNEHPATVEPFTLNVDKKKWEIPKNRLPPRPQSKVKEVAIREFIDEGLKLDIIEPSSASYWSQIHLVTKPNGKYRTCFDYRELNEATETSLGWTIPKILDLLIRIGDKKPKYFAVFDMTSGFHQVPIAREARDNTTFIVFCGTYRWKRLPMGLKAAPHFFQKQMASTVLHGLLYSILEIYMDDLIVYASSFEDLLNRIEIVLQRLAKYNITINPNKCKIGMTEIQYLGFKIDSEGIMTLPEKTNKLLEFPLPQTNKMLHQFLGLASHFRTHNRNHSSLVAPLHKLLKQKTINWTPELIEVFKNVKQSIEDLPKLHFIDDSPIYLHTDASAYGIGGYVFQLRNGVEYPIAFCSKSLNEQQRRWCTQEQECYAIFISLQKFEHILRDTKFILRTDHKCLTYLNASIREKVRRWKLFIQSYDFKIEFIEGRKNNVADAFSRLCAMTVTEVTRIPKQYYKIISQVHNSVQGHHGKDRTYDKILESNQPWPKMREHIDTFIKQCPICQKCTDIKANINSYPYTVSTHGIMMRLDIDTIGPLPPDSKGNEYILTVIDSFSRYVELYALPNTTAMATVPPLIEHIGRYGLPQAIQSDNGTQFANEIIEELCKTMHIDKKYINAYSKQENGIVERCNKEVMRHLVAMTNEKYIRADWSMYLPLIQRIINAQKHSATGIAPANLLYGDALKLDRWIFEIHDSPNKSTIEYFSKLRDAQKLLIETATKNQKEKDEYKLEQAPVERTIFELGSYVLSEYESQRPTKLHTKLQGPYRVISINNDNKNIYTVQDLVTNKFLDFHVKRLRQFNFDPSETDPRLVANMDQQVFDVEKVYSHYYKDKSKSRNKLIFRIKYKDYDETYESPYADLRHNAALHDYLRKHKMSSLIPPQFKDK